MNPDFLGNDLGRDIYERLKMSGQLTAAFSREVDSQLVERL